MKVTERQGKILNRIVEDYIDLAQPISSEFLGKKHKFSISPATIRIEMQKLTEGGYLFQPHTSAGRVPTDCGYRLFVNNLSQKELLEFKNCLELENILKEEGEDIFMLATKLTKFLADVSSNFAVLHLLEENFFWKDGWEEILGEPEFEERSLVFNFAEFLENFEKNVANLKINSGIKIYIGGENPFSKTKNFSIISSRCCLPANEEAILSLLGPTRMDYNKNISLLNSLVRFLEKF